jgi:hypothetical protein
MFSTEAIKVQHEIMVISQSNHAYRQNYYTDICYCFPKKPMAAGSIINFAMTKDHTK